MSLRGSGCPWGTLVVPGGALVVPGGALWLRSLQPDLCLEIFVGNPSWVVPRSRPAPLVSISCVSLWRAEPSRDTAGRTLCSRDPPLCPLCSPPPRGRELGSALQPPAVRSLRRPPCKSSAGLEGNCPGVRKPWGHLGCCDHGWRLGPPLVPPQPCHMLGTVTRLQPLPAAAPTRVPARGLGTARRLAGCPRAAPGGWHGAVTAGSSRPLSRQRGRAQRGAEEGPGG